MKLSKLQIRIGFAFTLLILAGATFLIAALLVNINERKQEAKQTFVKVTEVDESTVDAAEWGKNWPRQYDGYLRTSEPTRTEYGGGVGAEGHIPEQKAAKDPWLVRLFAGYLFSIDYRDRRGHAYMLHDQEVTKRNIPAEAKQSGNCLHCHASVTPLYLSKGKEALPNASEAEQIQKGLEIVGQMNYWDAHKDLGAISKIKGETGKPHPVSCVDCHNPKTMELRVTRPGFINAIRDLANSEEPTPHLPSITRWRSGSKTKPYDPNADATRQEMRSFTCGQCHVEYFCGKGTTIFFPWQKGLKVEQMESVYNNLEIPAGKRFKDWTHAETGIEVLKAQHPEFEVWSQGIHARSGVSCADCHMPYKREGAMKVSEHWVKSPLLMINQSCQTCHPFPESELADRVKTIQDRHHKLMTRTGEANIAMLDAIKPIKQKYFDKNREQASAQTKERLSKDEAFLKLAEADREKLLLKEIDNSLLALWQTEIANVPALKEIAELQRAAQWRLDYVAAENSMGFHAPQEMARILGESIDMARQAEVKARQFAATE